MATHCGILAWEIRWAENHGVAKKSNMTLQLNSNNKVLHLSIYLFSTNNQRGWINGLLLKNRQHLLPVREAVLNLSIRHRSPERYVQTLQTILSPKCVCMTFDILLQGFHWPPLSPRANPWVSLTPGMPRICSNLAKLFTGEVFIVTSSSETFRAKCDGSGLRMDEPSPAGSTRPRFIFSPNYKSHQKKCALQHSRSPNYTPVNFHGLSSLCMSV